jgi:hypothetical protein
MGVGVAYLLSSSPVPFEDPFFEMAKVVIFRVG